MFSSLFVCNFKIYRNTILGHFKKETSQEVTSLLQPIRGLLIGEQSVPV